MNINSANLPKILIVSIPKAGTNLVMQIILGIPGMKQIHRNIFQSNNDLVKNGEMGVLHLPYEERLEVIIQTNNIKVIFVSRDLRDVAVSMVKFILEKFPQHLFYPIFLNHIQDHDQRLLAVIKGVDILKDFSNSVAVNEWYVSSGVFHYPNIYQYNKPTLKWLNRPVVFHVRFEDLVASHSARVKSISRIVNFLWEDLKKTGLEKQFFVQKMQENINPLTSPTFRKGSIGEWKTQFKKEHKEAFKTVAGKAIINLGYENNQNW